MSEQPALSIIVAWQKSQAQANDCLDSLYVQSKGRPTEIILVTSHSGADIQGLPSRYPGLVLSAGNADTLPKLYGRGIQRASGKLIAVTEAHTTFDSGWIDKTIQACAERSAAAIGGAVEPGPALAGLDFALYLCDYVQFALPLEAGDSNDLPGNNVVFKSTILDQFRPNRQKLELDGFWKTFFCHELQEHGQALLREPNMVSYYNRHMSFMDMMVRRFNHGRCFGAMRSADFSPLKKLMYALSCAALPFVLDMRLAKKIGAKKKLIGRAVLVFPFCHLIICAWVLGEHFGTIFGAGTSCDQL